MQSNNLNQAKNLSMSANPMWHHEYYRPENETISIQKPSVYACFRLIRPNEVKHKLTNKV